MIWLDYSSHLPISREHDILFPLWMSLKHVNGLFISLKFTVPLLAITYLGLSIYLYTTRAIYCCCTWFYCQNDCLKHIGSATFGMSDIKNQFSISIISSKTEMKSSMLKTFSVSTLYFKIYLPLIIFWYQNFNFLYKNVIKICFTARGYQIGGEFNVHEAFDAMNNVLFMNLSCYGIRGVIDLTMDKHRYRRVSFNKHFWYKSEVWQGTFKVSTSL